MNSRVSRAQSLVILSYQDRAIDYYYSVRVCLAGDTLDRFMILHPPPFFILRNKESITLGLNLKSVSPTRSLIAITTLKKVLIGTMLLIVLLPHWGAEKVEMSPKEHQRELIR